MPGRPLRTLLVEVLDRDGTHIAQANPIRQDLIGSQVVHVYLAGRLITRNQHALPNRLQVRTNGGKVQRRCWRTQNKDGLVAELCGGRFNRRDWCCSGDGLGRRRCSVSALRLNSAPRRRDGRNIGDPFKNELQPCATRVNDASFAEDGKEGRCLLHGDACRGGDAFEEWAQL